MHILEFREQSLIKILLRSRTRKRRKRKERRSEDKTGGIQKTDKNLNKCAKLQNVIIVSSKGLALTLFALGLGLQNLHSFNALLISMPKYVPRVLKKIDLC